MIFKSTIFTYDVGGRGDIWLDDLWGSYFQQPIAIQSNI